MEYVKACVERLNSSGECSKNYPNQFGSKFKFYKKRYSGGSDWTPHKVELAVWTHYILKELNPELLTAMPNSTNSAKAETAGKNKD